MKPKILVCDDDSEMLKSLSLSLRSSYEVVTANSVSRAKVLVAETEFDAAVVDLNFEGQELDGIHLIDFFSKRSPSTYLVVLSGDNSTKRIVEATRRSLFEFVVKDELYFEKLIVSLRNATQLSLARRESAYSKFQTQSKEILTTISKIEAIVRSNSTSPILIQGESGTGKEFLFKYISHALKMKSIAVNMSNIPKDTAESILFGHERGAFTGALSNKTGLIETAHNGLLFLDEIGECSQAVQAKLLRVIQEREIQPLGSTKTKKVDVRFIAATHCNLEERVRAGTFRLDLLQRLNTFVLRLPSLRERPEDISFYANLFVSESADEKRRFSITADGEQELLRYTWPGNVRELKNVIERITVLSSKFSIDSQIVRDAIELGRAPMERKALPIQTVELNARKEEVVKALSASRGNKRIAALNLGVSEATLYRWLKDFNIAKSLSVESYKNSRELGF